MEIKDENKGTRHNEGKLKWSLVSWRALEPMVKVLMFGAEKYGPFNWQKGLDKKEILESAMRHLTSLMDGEFLDKESNLPHFAHVMCNMLFYSYFSIFDEEKK